MTLGAAAMVAAPIGDVPLEHWAERLTAAARTAGAAIMDVLKSDFAVAMKEDRSPVTAADAAAEAIVLAELERLTPAFPIVAEERVARDGLPAVTGQRFWLVDALDGTKEFVRRGTAFTVNIGLIVDGRPVLGIVHAPALNEIFVGIEGLGAKVDRGNGWQSITARRRAAGVTVVGSRSHEIRDELDAFLADYTVAESLAIGSSIKFCMLAEGKADLYPRFGPTNEWDTAAGDAVLRAAGGRVHTFDGHPLAYRKPEFRNGKFLAEGRA